MKLHVRYRNVHATPELRQRVSRRVHFAFSRLAHAIRRVYVTLADVNGPRGGIDKEVRVRVHGPRVGSIVIESAGVDAFAALDDAVARAARTTVRTLERRRVLGASD